MYKNCGHAIVLHKRNCLSKAVEIEDDISGCAGAQYYNGLILGTYVGWAEIHCQCSRLKDSRDRADRLKKHFSTA
jgi:hypothetical protein